MSESGRRIAVVGFGFSGLMVVANLVRQAQSGTVIYIVADHLDPVGVAYSTSITDHLLNVPAGKMGAFADAPEGFSQWLTTAGAALAKQRLGLSSAYTEKDFAPRALYGDYLRDVWHDTQSDAQARNVKIKLVETQATALSPGMPLTLLTERGDAIAIDRVVLALGNESSVITPHLPQARVIQNPWRQDAIPATAKNWASPIAILGTGLTAIDQILTLRAKGYAGEILALSRNGWLPQAHRPPERTVVFTRDEFPTPPSLRNLILFLKRALHESHDWRAVIDALRPHTGFLWQRLSTRDQAYFLARLSRLWNIHRHRMAPEIAQRIAREQREGSLRILSGQNLTFTTEGERLILHQKADAGTETFFPSYLINCTGPEMRLSRSRRTFVQQLLAAHVIEPHSTGAGLATDPKRRVWGKCYPYVYAMGNLLAGQWLESTAVPELRQQAYEIAKAIITDKL